MQSNTTETSISSSLWTKQQLEEVLYQWDSHASPVIEYAIFNSSRLTWPHDVNQVTVIVEFYAPWCPHCQEFKDHYINVAKKVTRRAVDSSNIFFYAVSCTLHELVCSHYHVDGFPTILAWGPHETLQHDIHQPGFLINGPDSPSLTPDHLAQMVGIELITQDYNKNNNNRTSTSNDTHRDDDYYYDDVEIPSATDALQLANRAAWNKLYSYHYLLEPITNTNNKHINNLSFDQRWIYTKNYRFHDAAKSLLFLLRHAFTTIPRKTSVITGGNLTTSSTPATALVDFLRLLDWATPPTWNVRTRLVHPLLQLLLVPTQYENSTNTQILGWWEDELLKQKLSYILEQYDSDEITSMKHSPKELENHTFTYINIPFGFIYPINVINSGNMTSHWSPVCSHIYSKHDTSQPTSRTTGYTCGLWQLFHIITVGSSLPRQQIFGHLMGYTTSTYHVAKSIKQVVQQFFACDVCRKNFVTMYDTCGHDHCHRFVSSSQHSILDSAPYNTMNENYPQAKDLVIWLWEVHNSVNVRIMGEHATKQKRPITATEVLAAKFPTKIMCPLCWKDSNRNRPNPDPVYNFLREMYWPGYYSIGGKQWLYALNKPSSAMTRVTHREQLWTTQTEESGEPLGYLGLVCVTIPLLYIACLFIRKVVLMDDLWTNVFKRRKRN